MSTSVVGFELSTQQARLWLSQSDNQMFRSQLIVLIEGLIDSSILKRTLENIVNRHEILRTTFYKQSGMDIPIQVVNDEIRIGWKAINLRDQRIDNQSEILERVMADERASLMNYENGPLLHSVLISLSANEHSLILTMPALYADLWALRNIANEISTVYNQYAIGQTLLAEPLQYIDYAEWHNELVSTEDGAFKQGRTYWSKQNIPLNYSMQLPLALKGGSNRFRPESYHINIPTDLSIRLAKIAREYETSEASILLACWQTVLWRITGQTELVISSILDGRKYEEIQNVIGLLAHTIPILASINKDLSFNNLLRSTHASMVDAYKWQEYYDSQQKTQSAQSFPVAFEYIEAGAKKTNSYGISFSISRLYSCIDQFDLKLSCTKIEDSLKVDLYYDADRYEYECIKLLGSYIEALIENATLYPETKLDALNLLNETERHKLLREYSRSSSTSLQKRLLHELFEEQVKQTPNRIAVIAKGEQLTYGELNAKSNQLAHLLRRYGVEADTRVGLCVKPSVNMLISLLGIMKAGGAYVPLNDEYPKARLAQQIHQTEIPVIVTEKSLLPYLPDSTANAICIDQIELDQEESSNLTPISSTSNLAYVIYTSGSTGIPKGVGVTHQNLVNYTSSICNELALHNLSNIEPLHFATVSTITADLGNTAIFPSLLSGGSLHILNYDIATDSDRFATYMAKHPIDILKIVPSHFNALLKFQSSNILPNKFLIFGGEPLPFELIQTIKDLREDCQIINHYGPTETTIGALTHRYNDGSSIYQISSTVPIGRPIANTEIYIVDQQFNPVPIGIAGELLIGGEGLSRGYLQQPVETAERFIPNPFSTKAGASLYRTGDLVRYLHDGNVEFLGRIDQQVKIRGFRLELGEVEATIREYAGIKQVVVIAKEDSSGHKYLVAYLVSSSKEKPVSIDKLETFLRERLPDYMVPSAFITLESIPLTRNGKVDRHALPALERNGQKEQEDIIGPRTPIEKLLTDIWSQVLQLEYIGIHDNFFKLGGDSILSIQIIARANQAGLRLTPKQLFEHQTIAELASIAEKSSIILAKQETVIGPVPLTPIQRYFFEQEFPEPHHFNQSVLLEINRPFNLHLLEPSIEYILGHHDALRLRFTKTEDGWRQFNSGLHKTISVEGIDLSRLPLYEQTVAIEKISSEYQSSLNLSDGPVLRAIFFDLGEGSPGRLLIIVHHLLIDGVSWRILLEDLQTVYSQLNEGKEPELPAKTTSFKDWAELLVKHAEADMMEDEINYWLSQTRISSIGLPVDFPNGENLVTSARALSVSLSQEETQSLVRDVPSAYQTQINDVLLVALAQSIRDWTNRGMVSVDLEGHGREDIFDNVDLSRTIGWFTINYPVLIDIGTTSNPGEALKVVKEQLRSIPNRGIGYGILRYLSNSTGIVERLNKQPPSDIKFNYLGQFNSVFNEASIFKPAKESSGLWRSQLGKRSHKLIINGAISGGTLQMHFEYSENLYKRSTINSLAQNYIKALKQIIAHCQSSTAGGFTPSDFPLMQFNQKELDDLVLELYKEVED
jgi:amino acid adenylation domain-containing protein/non-ribosomal peptide synthase protein (TIGR01720 family)